MAAATRQRMVEAAAGLLRAGGLSAANFSDVLASSGAARGAIYHHFPKGKSQLTREAVAWTGERVQANIAALGGDDPQQIVASFLTAIRPVVGEAAEGISCAVAAVVVEAGQRDDALTATAQTALRSWIDVLATRLISVGITPSVADGLAILMITFLEGTQVLCRAAGDLTAFDDAGAVLAALVAAGTTTPSDPPMRSPIPSPSRRSAASTTSTTSTPSPPKKSKPPAKPFSLATDHLANKRSRKPVT